MSFSPSQTHENSVQLGLAGSSVDTSMKDFCSIDCIYLWLFAVFC